jgi:hypothetical protein
MKESLDRPVYQRNLIHGTYAVDSTADESADHTVGLPNVALLHWDFTNFVTPLGLPLARLKLKYPSRHDFVLEFNQRRFLL